MVLIFEKIAERNINNGIGSCFSLKQFTILQIIQIEINSFCVISQNS